MVKVVRYKDIATNECIETIWVNSQCMLTGACLAWSLEGGKEANAGNNPNPAAEKLSVY